MAWAAAWMYKATKTASYLNDASTFYFQHSQVEFVVPMLTSLL